MIDKREVDILKNLNTKMDVMDDVQKAEFKGYLKEGIALMSNHKVKFRKKLNRSD